MSETALLPPLIDFSSAPAGFGRTGSCPSGWSRGGTMGFGDFSPGRFGAPSMNAFFTRHTAKPKRVRHIKGLLGVPICSVNDEGYFSNPRYSFQYQPSTARASFSSGGYTTSRSDLRSTLTRSAAGNKQWGTRNFKIRRSGPPNGFIPEVWRDELRAITDVVLKRCTDDGQAVAAPTGISQNRPDYKARDQVTISPAEKPIRKTQYSPETGRIVPSPPKLLSSRRRWTPSGVGTATMGSRDRHRWTEISEETQADDLMLQMLCQVLQTDDIGAVQAWLMSAHDREKSMVIEMISSALDSTDVQELLAGKREPQSTNDWSQDVPSVDAVGGRVDRLLIDDNFSGEKILSDIIEKPTEEQVNHKDGNENKDKDEFDKARRPATSSPFRRMSRHSSEHRAERSDDVTLRKSCLKKIREHEPALSREATDVGRQTGKAAKKNVDSSATQLTRSYTTV